MKHRCGYCQDDILGIRIRCNVCVDYELCLQVWQYSLSPPPPSLYLVFDDAHILPVPRRRIQKYKLIFLFIFV